VDLQIDATASGNAFCDGQITVALPSKKAHS
jgi:hypothetical protein